MARFYALTRKGDALVYSCNSWGETQYKGLPRPEKIPALCRCYLDESNGELLLVLMPVISFQFNKCFVFMLNNEGSRLVKINSLA